MLVAGRVSFAGSSRSVGICLFVHLLPESGFLILFGALRADFLLCCCSVFLSNLIHFEALCADVLPYCCFAVFLAVFCFCLAGPLHTPPGTMVDASPVVPSDLVRQLRRIQRFRRNLLFPSRGHH